LGTHWQGANPNLAEPDTWFTLEVIAQGKRIIVKLNDKTALDHTDEKWTTKPGVIALHQMDKCGLLKIRKIEIKEFPPSKPAGSQPKKDASSLGKHRLDGFHWQVEMQSIVFKGDESELCIERPSLVVDGPKIDGKGPKLVGKFQGRMQGVKEERFPQAFASKGQVHGQTAEMHGRDGVFGELLAVGRRQATNVEGTRCQGVVSGHAGLAGLRGHERSAKPSFFVLGDQCAQEIIERRFAAGELGACVRRPQAFADPISHDAS
jgi:hypothetical protein